MSLSQSDLVLIQQTVIFKWQKTDTLQIYEEKDIALIEMGVHSLDNNRLDFQSFLYFCSSWEPLNDWKSPFLHNATGRIKCWADIGSAWGFWQQMKLMMAVQTTQGLIWTNIPFHSPQDLPFIYISINIKH